MADNNTIARPYAQAVFELAMKLASSPHGRTSLDAAAQLSGDGQVAEYLANPAFERAAARVPDGAVCYGGADGSAGGDKKGTNFLKLLLENGRVAVLPRLPSISRRSKQTSRTRVDATVTSAAR